MKTPLLIAVVAAALALPALPTAQADHIGPCWHEYVEVVLYSIGQSPKQILWNVGDTVHACLDNPVCDIIRPCVIS